MMSIGVVMFWLQANPTTLGIEGFAIDLLPEPHIALTALLVAAAVGVIASLGPAIEVLRRPLALSVMPA